MDSRMGQLRQQIKLTDNLKVAEDRPEVQIEANKHPGSPDLASPPRALERSGVRNLSQTDQHESLHAEPGHDVAPVDTAFEGSSIHATVKRQRRHDSPLAALLA